MIHSISVQHHKVSIPQYIGEVKMLPFNMADTSNVPSEFKPLIDEMLSVLPIKEGIAYLTIDGKIINSGATHRRGGAHIDGNYLVEACGWGSGGGNGWKVGEGGRELSTEHHKRSYASSTGGMLIVSDYQTCKGWNGVYNGVPGIGGDCSNIELDNGFMLSPNVLYYGNSQFIHETLPVEKEVHRTLVRITLPEDYPALNQTSK